MKKKMNLIKYCNCCLNLCRVDKKAKTNQGKNTKLETNLEKTVNQSGKKK
jgi:hypothetical protein